MSNPLIKAYLNDKNYIFGFLKVPSLIKVKK